MVVENSKKRDNLGSGMALLFGIAFCLLEFCLLFGIVCSN
jgi:hypothetical protein